MVIRSSYHGKDGKHNFWDFPKGLLEKGEKGIDAAMREAKEEVGINDFLLDTDFKRTIRYFTRWRNPAKANLKFVALFLAESKTDKVKLSWEHDQYEWLSYVKARVRVSLPQMKKALADAEQWLNKKRR